MENKIEKGKYLNYISGLKGMACLFIMCFHYLEIYKASPDFLPRIKLFDIILDSAIGFLFNQGYCSAFGNVFGNIQFKYGKKY